MRVCRHDRGELLIGVIPVVVIEHCFIEAESYRLEAIFSKPKAARRGGFVLCHPYPIYGGDMFHKVLVKLADLLLSEGFFVMRYNMRGTGRSTGEHTDTYGSREDLGMVLDWISKKEPSLPLFLAGYSYGAYIALSALTPGPAGAFPGRFPVKGVIAVAYPAGMPEYVLENLPDVECTCIHGTEDELIPPDQLKRFIRSRSPGVKTRWIEGANHFFDGRLTELQEAFKACLEEMG